jgi:hypothetical protein
MGPSALTDAIEVHRFDGDTEEFGDAKPYRSVQAYVDELEKEIRTWMRTHRGDHADRKTNEVDCTALVEAWDHQQSTGMATLDPDHIAWDIAVEVAEGEK